MSETGHKRTTATGTCVCGEARETETEKQRETDRKSETERGKDRGMIYERYYSRAVSTFNSMGL